MAKDVLYKSKNNSSEIKEQKIAPITTKKIFKFKDYFNHISLLWIKRLMLKLC